MLNNEYRKYVSSELVDTQMSYNRKLGKRRWSWGRIIRSSFLRGVYFGLSNIKQLINKRQVLRNTSLIRPFALLTIATSLISLISS